MQNRVYFLEQEIARGVEIGTIVFLTGDRMRYTDRETDQVLPGADRCVNEYELAQLVYEKSHLPKTIPAVFIHAPIYPGISRHVTSRSNLEDTLISWGKLQPKAGSALFVTNQPYLLFQRHLVERVLLEHGMSADCCAAQAGPKTKLATYLQSLARWGSWQIQNSTSHDTVKPNGR